MSSGSVIIFVNGVMEDGARIKRMISSTTLIVAVDGGLKHVRALGLKPNLVIGDLDSISRDEIPALEGEGIRVLRFNKDKDETDLELALNLPEVASAAQVIIAAAFGGRLDQTLANIMLLTRPKFLGRDIGLDDGHTQAFLIHSRAVLTGAAGDTISLLPVHNQAGGVLTKGLKYPLDHETLYPGSTRGISNEMTNETAEIMVEEGVLLCVHIRNY